MTAREPGNRWNVLYTKPYRESTVCSWLAERGMPVYFPEVQSPVRGGRTVMKPFFPCYVFAQLDTSRSDLSTLNWTPGLRRVVAFDGIPATVSDAFIQGLRERLEEINERGWSPFASGDRVQVTEGPLKDMVGVFSRRCSAARRVQILLDILGKQTRCEIDLHSLKKV